MNAPRPAGRDLDAEVAEKIFGRRVQIMGNEGGDDEWYELVPPAPSDVGELWNEVPRYSTDIAAAWDVVEKMDVRSEGAGLIIDKTRDGYRVSFFDPGYRPFQDISGQADAPTAPLAICLAALAALQAVTP